MIKTADGIPVAAACLGVGLLQTGLLRVEGRAGDSGGTSPRRRRTDEGKLYLCAIKDVYSNRIAGYSIDSRMKASLAVSALHNAIGLRGPAGTAVHSDRKSQFRSHAFERTLEGNKLKDGAGRCLCR
ncbi:transposase InsO family protein [Arthrobacter sp. UYP6]